LNAHLRVARPTDQLEAIVNMYKEGLSLEILGSFEGHQGFDGVMLGNAEMGYHFEFTRHRGHPVGKAPTQDNLLVFYIPDRAEWETRCQKMGAAGFKPVRSYNPYWEKSGKTFEDLDGYRVVIQNADWPNG
jgi:YycE-like C-terminal domain/YycE-like N-terminal domain